MIWPLIFVPLCPRAGLTFGRSVTDTSDEALSVIKFSSYNQKWLWLAFFASFAAKVPMLPVHIRLPEAHVEAPTAGSVILAGILLKLVSYGILRFSLGIFPEASLYFTPFIFSSSVLGVVYTSLLFALCRRSFFSCNDKILNIRAN